MQKPKKIRGILRTNCSHDTLPNSVARQLCAMLSRPPLACDNTEVSGGRESMAPSSPLVIPSLALSPAASPP
jgi:hypothetical protein